MTRAERVPELDGIRGLGILLVFGYHLSLQYPRIYTNPALETLARILNGGWSGVDIFFVLSGFLITGILLESRETPRYYRNFYGRRVLRIFPVYYIALTVLFLLVDPAQYNGLSQFVTAHYLYLQNWLFALGAMGAADFLGHFWSLAIEEQFYLMWPAVVRRLTPRKLLWLSLGTIIGVLALRVVILLAGGVQATQMFLYASTITRLDALAFGALVAVLFFLDMWKEAWTRLAKIGLVISALATLAVFFVGSSATLWFNPFTQTIGYTLIALFGACLVVLARKTDENSVVRRILRSGLFTFTGKYSYAMYIFHWPIISGLALVFTSQKWLGPGWWVVYSIACMAATTLLALVSWHLVEKNALKLKRYFE